MVPTKNPSTHNTELDHTGTLEGLLMALNPYMDDMCFQPTFHLFMDLPAELRCLVYDQYFLDEKSSIACRNWPHLQFSREYELWLGDRPRKTAPFLPPLCLVNKELQSELLSCLLEAAHFEFDDGVALGRRLTLLHTCLLQLHLTVRKATIGDVNGQRKQLLSGSENSESQTIACELAQTCNSLFGSMMPYAPQIRELNLTLYAPLLRLDTRLYSSQIPTIHTLALDKYLCGFELDAILGLDRQINIDGNKIIDDNKSKNLNAILDLCQQIKHGFSKQKRSVVVKACLRYGVNECTEKIIK